MRLFNFSLIENDPFSGMGLLVNMVLWKCIFPVKRIRYFKLFFCTAIQRPTAFDAKTFLFELINRANLYQRPPNSPFRFP